MKLVKPPKRKDSPAFYLGDKKGYDIIGANVFLRWLMRFLLKKGAQPVCPMLTMWLSIIQQLKRIAVFNLLAAF